MDYGCFGNFDEFLGYCRIHSETPRALFYIEHVAMLYEMAGYSPISENVVSQNYPVVSIHKDEMNEILEIIRSRKNSVDVEFENLD